MKDLLARVFVLLLILLAIGAPVAANLLEDAFSPLRDLDIPRFYDHYSSVIDAILFCIIFVGVAQISLGKFFGQTRAAKALVIGVGLTLTLGLVLMERQMSFSLIQFGPLAAGIFVFLAASVLFHLLRVMGVGGMVSLSTSFIIVYFMMRAVVPSFFYYLQEKAPGLHAMIALAVLICIAVAIWKLLTTFWPGAGETLEKVKMHLEAPQRSKGAQAEIGEELKLMRGKLDDVQRQSVKDSQAIITDLDSIIAAIDQHGDSQHTRQLIAGKLEHDVVPREHRLTLSLAALRKLYERVERFELGMLAELKRLPPAERKAAEQETKSKIQKLNIEERIKKLAERVDEHDRLFRARIAQAVREINAGRMDAGRTALVQAREAEREIRELEEDIQKLGSLLRALAAREVVGRSRQWVGTS